MFRFKLTRSLHVCVRFSGSVFRARLVAQAFQEEREMPVVNITWLEGRTVDQKRKVAQRITQVLIEEAGAKSESTHIVIVDIPATNFASGGVTVADKKRSA